MLVCGWANNFGKKDFSYRKSCKKHSIFYIVFLQTHEGHRYLKFGTTEQSLGARFAMDDYKKYAVVRILLMIELDSKNDCYQLEDLTKAYFRYEKGFTWVKNDRFNYFTLPDEIPLFDKPMHQMGVCKLVKATKERPSHYALTLF